MKKRQSKESRATRSARSTKEADTYSPRETQARFERAVDAAVATKPIHRATKKAASRRQIRRTHS